MLDGYLRVVGGAVLRSISGEESLLESLNGRTRQHPVSAGGVLLVSHDRVVEPGGAPQKLEGVLSFHSKAPRELCGIHSALDRSAGETSAEITWVRWGRLTHGLRSAGCSNRRPAGTVVRLLAPRGGDELRVLA